MFVLHDAIAILVGSVVGSLGLCAGTLLLVRTTRLGGLWAAVLCVGAMLLCSLWVVWGMALALLVALWSSGLSGRGRSAFPRRAAIALVATAGGTASWLGWMALGYDQLRANYPLVSLRDRLPARTPIDIGPVKLGPAAEERLERVEALSGGVGGIGTRPFRLRMLHERSLALFANRLDFGPRRMGPIFPTAANLALHDVRVEQPGVRVGPSSSAGDWRDLPGGALNAMAELHTESVGRFAWSFRSGYVRDVDHVAGFAPHRLDERPNIDWDWEVATVDLVGLDRAEPVAFESPYLPDMGDIATTPPRPLDGFEAAALATLWNGDDLIAVRDGNVVRMLGAVRAGAKCLACHRGERGRLLGAFTYTIRRPARAPIRD